MRIEHPGEKDVPALRQLWKTAFGDDDGFLDDFFALAWQADHSLCAREGEGLAGMLYWLDGSCGGQKIGYLYAVATAPACRGRGICRRLLEQAEQILKSRGYGAALLVPGSPGLRGMYEKLGWKTVTKVDVFACRAEEQLLTLRRVEKEEYAILRRAQLPAGGVVQEGKSLDFLASQEQFFAGNGVLLAGHWDNGRLITAEYLGDPQLAPGVLWALGADSGSFRSPGGGIPFAMEKRLSEKAPEIRYFGLAFD